VIHGALHDRRTQALPKRFDAAAIHLNFKNRAALYRRIDSRVDRMDELGLFDEVEGLLSSGLSPDCNAMQAIGYKEAVLAIEGRLSRQQALELIKLNSRRYAKRQLTWFNRNKEALSLLWDDEPDFEYARRLSTEFLLSHGIS
jgi:tRNA dimethylallyltransferase